MRRRTVLWSIAGVLSVTAGLWATDWALLYWVAIPFVYRAAPLPESQVLRGIPYDPQAPSDGKRQLDLFLDRKSTRLNSSHIQKSRMPSSA